MSAPKCAICDAPASEVTVVCGAHAKALGHPAEPPSLGVLRILRELHQARKAGATHIRIVV